MRRRSAVWQLATVVAAAATVLPGAGGTPGAAASADQGSGLSSLLGSAIDSTLWGDDTSHQGKQASKSAGGWDASADLGSMYSITKAIGAQRAWARGYTGKNVTVAVVDTGIAPVQGLDGDNKVLDGPDLSYDGQSANTRYLDGYGHGTHMAGIIAGEDDNYDPRRPDPSMFAGVAPDAQLLNMKVGAGDGGVDVTQVIAALDWIVQHSHDQGMNVRVVNLAYGTESLQPWQVDPLAKAVEDAWNHGIVVVAAAGNDGLDAPNLLMPAIDPHVIAVGAVDNVGTAQTADDTVADFTSGGTSGRRPDVLAPGKSVVSLRVPNSYIDETHPEGLVAGDTDGRFFRGSGTSQATAVVSGEVALLLQAHPNLTPDQVKTLLQDTADPLVQHPAPAMGNGVVDVNSAIDMLNVKSLTASLGRLLGGPTSTPPSSTGLGSLEASRGGEHVVDPTTGDVLSGELDAQGVPWDGAAWARSSTLGKAWSKGGVWNGHVWTTDNWDHGQVQAAAWSGSSWSGIPWSQHEWSDATWEARSWRNDDWQARSWREATWLARSWRDHPEPPPAPPAQPAQPAPTLPPSGPPGT
jgi:serine protease AprX